MSYWLVILFIYYLSHIITHCYLYSHLLYLRDLRWNPVVAVDDLLVHFRFHFLCREAFFPTTTWQNQYYYSNPPKCKCTWLLKGMGEDTLACYAQNTPMTCAMHFRLCTYTIKIGPLV